MNPKVGADRSKEIENSGTEPKNNDYDVLIIGSGFGGSTAALRLTEKGYKVGVLEAGRRFDEKSFPRTSWDLRSFLWAPLFGCFGIQRISLLKNVMVMSGAGVGGGSLVYANTLYVPGRAFFFDPQWSHITDWEEELVPFYEQARRMLGVVNNPGTSPSDEVMRKVAREMGVEHSFRQAPVGVYFGPVAAEGKAKAGDEVDDPYFGGAGPRRSACIQCGECMTGCRHHAKNSLLKNYLYLAEKGGAEVHPLTTVTAVRQLPNGHYAVDTVQSDGSLFKGKKRRTYIAGDVIFAAGTLGTQKLLHQMRDEGHLPNLSARLGELTRTNSEAIIGARAFRPDVDFTKGLAITSSFYPDPETHIEPVRYGKGSNLMGLLTTAMADGGDRSRFLTWFRTFLRNPGAVLRNLSMRKWSEQTIIALVMQSHNNSITCYTKKGLFGRRITSKQGQGMPNPTWIPAGHEAVRRIARHIGGEAYGGWNDVFDIPMTAHFLGGAVIGDSIETGVIDPYHRVYGYPGLHVVDGAAVSANLGVNPSLTITAQAERAMALWPNKGEVDQRPPLPGKVSFPSSSLPGSQSLYKRLKPIFPKNPIVPAHAPAAYRLSETVKLEDLWV